MTMRQAFWMLLFFGTGVAAAETEPPLALAHPSEPLAGNRTVVWTPLFQAAWEELHRGFGAPTAVEPPNPLMDKLDRFEWEAATVMPADGWQVWAGPASAEFAAKANAEAVRLTGEAGPPFSVPPGDQANGRVALGLLRRNLVFARMLHLSLTEPLDFQPREGGKLAVRFFGVRGALSGKQRDFIRILAYDGGQSFALQIGGQGDAAVVLYLPKVEESMADACAKLREWRGGRLAGEFGSAQDPWIHEQDDLRVPKLKLQSTADFQPQLASLRGFPTQTVPWRLAKAEQRVDFELSEKGAQLRVVVEQNLTPFGEPPAPPPMVARKFLFDRPFFVFLWRDKAQWPYFGAWIGDGSALDKFR